MKKYIGVLFMIAAMGLPSFVLAGMEGLSISIKPLINESGSSKIGLLLTNKDQEAVRGKIILKLELGPSPVYVEGLQMSDITPNLTRRNW